MPGRTNFFDAVYDVKDTKELTNLYDDWSTQYEQDLADQSYATPARVAAALAAFCSDKTTPVLDFGCGTGLAGMALKAEGFTHVDGQDISIGMLAKAKVNHVYAKLDLVLPDASIPSGYGAIVAAGVIGVGAAPAETLKLFAPALKPGALFAFSMNDHTLHQSEYTNALHQLLKSKVFSMCYEEYGAHLPGLGLKSKVFILRRQG